jgi:hypothetical protein
VTPAPSTGVALSAGGSALSQLWLFWQAPIVGGALGGVLCAVAFEAPAEAPTKEEEVAATFQRRRAHHQVDVAIRAVKDGPLLVWRM